MHINCHKDDLLFGVQTVNRAVSNKNTLPILSGILLTCENNILSFRAIDMEIAIQCSVKVDVIEEGSLVLPGKYFTEIVKKLPSGIINLKSNDHCGVEIKYEQSEMSINGFAAEEFPSLPEFEQNIYGSIPKDIFKKIIKQVSVATSNDESRPVFTGILMEIMNNQVSFVGTDTHRLALKTADWQGEPVADKISMIIPTRTMIETARIIGDEEEQLKIFIGKNQVCFDAGNISLISRLIDGQYPNYRQVIPDSSKFKSRIRVRTKKLLDAAERASLMVRDEMKERFSLIKLNADQEVLSINSNSPEIGKIYEEITAYLEGDPTEIVFNSRYLIDALKVIDSDEIYLELIGSLSPGIIRTVEGEEYIYLILPVRTA